MANPEFVKHKSAFARHVGIEDVGAGRSFRLKVGPCHMNATGIYAHGGAIFTLADRAFACAVNSRGKSAVAMEMKINYLLPVKAGDVLRTRAKIIKEGRSTSVCLVEVLRGREIVAIVLATGFNIVK